MTDDNELDPLAQLRAADPAAGVEPAAGFAADVVARATAEGATVEGAPAGAAPVAELATARSRRRRLWLPVAAVAASIAVFGGAGFALGATTTGGATLAAAPITVGGQSAGGGADGGAGATEARKLAVPGAADRFMGFGRNAFTASGLATSTGTAKGYGYDPRAASDTATVTSLATALGITTAPALADGTWTAGKQDGTGPSLTVSLDGTLGFFYSDPPLYPSGCAEPDSTGGAASTDPAAPCEPATPSLPSADAAVAALRTLVTATGHDAAAFAFTSETPDGALTRSAQAWPVVDGQRVDQSWSLELTGAGIVSASGSLAPLVALGDYPVVSEQQAFERLSDPRFGAQQAVMPLAARTMGTAAIGGDTATPAPAAPTEPPAAPAAGTPLSWPVHDVHIVSARLGLTTQWQPDGSVLVVPAYEFTDTEGGTWSVIAVAESKLDFGGE